MNCQILHNSTDITNEVTNYTREQELCSGLGMLTLGLVETGRTFDPWDTITIYEDENKRAVYYIGKIEKKHDGSITIEGQDGSKKLQDYFISDTYSLEDNEESHAKVWITRFLNESGVSHNYVVSGSGSVLSNNTSLGLSSAYDQITTLLQQCGWYLYFDKDNVAIISKANASSTTYAELFDDTKIISVIRSKNDSILRNRAVVWGNGDPLTGKSVFADIHSTNAWNYGAKDLRAVVLANSNIRNNAEANKLAKKMLTAFNKLTDEITVEVAGTTVANLGDFISISSAYYTGIKLLTSISVKMDKSGLVTTLTLNQKCPRLFAYFNNNEIPPDGEGGPYVYVGTTNGVAKKALDSTTWIDDSVGLINKNIIDLCINDGVFGCVSDMGDFYYRAAPANSWSLFTPPNVTDLDTNTEVPSTELLAKACTLNKLTNILSTGYTTASGTSSWIFDINSSGTVIENNQIIVEEEFDYRLADIDSLSNLESQNIISITRNEFTTTTDDIIVPVDLGIGIRGTSYNPDSVAIPSATGTLLCIGPEIGDTFEHHKHLSPYTVENFMVDGIYLWNQDYWVLEKYEFSSGNLVASFTAPCLVWPGYYKAQMHKGDDNCMYYLWEDHRNSPGVYHVYSLNLSTGITAEYAGFTNTSSAPHVNHRNIVLFPGSTYPDPANQHISYIFNWGDLSYSATPIDTPELQGNKCIAYSDDYIYELYTELADTGLFTATAIITNAITGAQYESTATLQDPNYASFISYQIYLFPDENSGSIIKGSNIYSTMLYPYADCVDTGNLDCYSILNCKAEINGTTLTLSNVNWIVLHENDSYTTILSNLLLAGNGISFWIDSRHNYAYDLCTIYSMADGSVMGTFLPFTSGYGNTKILYQVDDVDSSIWMWGNYNGSGCLREISPSGETIADHSFPFGALPSDRVYLIGNHLIIARGSYGGFDIYEIGRTDVTSTPAYHILKQTSTYFENILTAFSKKQLEISLDIPTIIYNLAAMSGSYLNTLGSFYTSNTQLFTNTHDVRIFNLTEENVGLFTIDSGTLEDKYDKYLLLAMLDTNLYIINSDMVDALGIVNEFDGIVQHVETNNWTDLPYIFVSVTEPTVSGVFYQRTPEETEFVVMSDNLPSEIINTIRIDDAL